MTTNFTKKDLSWEEIEAIVDKNNLENRERSRKYRLENKEKLREKRREYREKNKDKIRNSALMKKYGLTYEDFQAILLRQTYTCAICHTELVSNAESHVDHDHATGKVRGLLCTKCNVGLGMFGDDPERLKRAINYIHNNGEK